MEIKFEVRDVRRLIEQRNKTYRREYCDYVQGDVDIQYTKLLASFNEKLNKYNKSIFKAFKKEPDAPSREKASLSLLAQYEFYGNHAYRYVRKRQEIRNRLSNTLKGFAGYSQVTLTDEEVEAIIPYTSPYEEDTTLTIHQDFIEGWLKQKFGEA